MITGSCSSVRSPPDAGAVRTAEDETAINGAKVVAGVASCWFGEVGLDRAEGISCRELALVREEWACRREVGGLDRVEGATVVP